MADFKMKRGESSRISTDKTKFQDGVIYLTTDDGWIYTDAMVGNQQKRIRTGGTRLVRVAATLTSKGWDKAAKTQKITVTGLGANQDGDIGLSMSANKEAREAARKARLTPTAQEAGSLTITADGEVPSVDIPVTVTLYV